MGHVLDGMGHVLDGMGHVLDGMGHVLDSIRNFMDSMLGSALNGAFCIFHHVVSFLYNGHSICKRDSIASHPSLSFIPF